MLLQTYADFFYFYFFSARFVPLFELSTSASSCSLLLTREQGEQCPPDMKQEPSFIVWEGMREIKRLQFSPGEHMAFGEDARQVTFWGPADWWAKCARALATSWFVNCHHTLLARMGKVLQQMHLRGAWCKKGQEWISFSSAVLNSRDATHWSSENFFLQSKQLEFETKYLCCLSQAAWLNLSGRRQKAELWW